MQNLDHRCFCCTLQNPFLIFSMWDHLFANLSNVSLSRVLSGEHSTLVATPALVSSATTVKTQHIIGFSCIITNAQIYSAAPIDCILHIDFERVTTSRTCKWRFRSRSQLVEANQTSREIKQSALARQFNCVRRLESYEFTAS